MRALQQKHSAGVGVRGFSPLLMFRGLSATRARTVCANRCNSVPDAEAAREVERRKHEDQSDEGSKRSSNGTGYASSLPFVRSLGN